MTHNTNTAVRSANLDRNVRNRFREVLTGSELRDRLTTSLPVLQTLQREDGRPSRFRSVVSRNGRTEVGTVGDTFRMETPETFLAKVQTVAEAIHGPGALAEPLVVLRQTRDATRTYVSIPLTLESDPANWTALALLIWQPAKGSTTFGLELFRAICENGLHEFDAIPAVKVRNGSDYHDRATVAAIRNGDLSANVAGILEFIRKAEGVRVADDLARQVFARALGETVETCEHKRGRALANLDRLMMAYRDAPGAIPGTVRGLLEAATYYDSNIAPVRDRTGNGTDATELRFDRALSSRSTVRAIMPELVELARN